MKRIEKLAGEICLKVWGRRKEPGPPISSNEIAQEGILKGIELCSEWCLSHDVYPTPRIVEAIINELEEEAE